MIGDTPWRYEFEYGGGYDGMSSGFIVYDMNDLRLFTIDVVDFDDGDEPTDEDPWDWRHRRSERAEAMAFFIVRRANQLSVMTYEDAFKYIKQSRAEEKQ